MGINDFSSIIIFATFMGLLGWTIYNQPSRTQLRLKSYQDWLLDGIGLIVQGIGIPLLQISLIYWLYQTLIPDYQNCLNLSFIPSFIISFLIIDYLYYWNHRLLHSKLFWPIHQVHHTVTQMDVLGTSRNTIWTSFFILYLWIHPLFIYLLDNPTGYLLGIALTSALDLWRHSSLLIPANSCLYLLLSPWLNLPQNHAWHHCSETSHYNYGANLKIWDKLQGTYYENPVFPAQIGISISLTLKQKLFLPFL